MTWNLKRIALYILTAVVTSLVCIGAYLFNNKYTHNRLQPECGQMVVSEAALGDFHYLINDWEFYPDVLLTPEDLKNPDTAYYMIYTDIGERTRFDSLKNSSDPHGSGTYALHLWLPDEMHSYSLELPEIFSAYHLYINGDEYLQMGVPEPEQYDACTQTKVITFRGKDRVDLLISVSDFSHFYSGIVYPPVFGLESEIMHLRDLRQSITLIVVTFGLILLCSNLYLGIQMKRTNALLFALLSLCMCLILLFPFLHTMLKLPVFPWYALELACIYLMPFLVVLLHNRICEVQGWPRILSATITACFCCIACGYGLNAATLTVPVMRCFSSLLFLFKISLALYLMITAHMALNAGTEDAKLLCYASVSYAVVFLWDRIFPSFEPIFYGWFTDLGSLILVVAIGCTLLHDMAAAYTRNLSFAEEHRQVARQLAMQQEYSRRLSEQSEKNRRLIHDFRQHIRTISGMMEKLGTEDSESSEAYKDLHDYLSSLSADAVSSSDKTYEEFSGNPAVNALLNYYYSYAVQQKIQTEFSLVSEKTELTDVEYCTILGNLLENAIDACTHLPENSKRIIRLNSRATEHILFIRIDNTYDGVVLKENRHFLSRKEESGWHGIGMESAREIIETHGGTMDIYPFKNFFRIGISLPLKS